VPLEFLCAGQSSVSREAKKAAIWDRRVAATPKIGSVARVAISGRNLEQL
jgi:hypothetical protein